MLGFIIKVFKAINSNSNPNEIAHAFSCALLLGFLPKDNLLWYLILVFCLFLRINKAAYALLIILFSFLAPFFDNLFDTIGYAILTLGPLQNVFNALLKVPFVAFTSFNNTIVMGSLISGIVLYVPIFFLAKLLVKLWRKNAYPFLAKTKLIKAIGKLPLIKKIAKLAASEVK